MVWGAKRCRVCDNVVPFLVLRISARLSYVSACRVCSRVCGARVVTPATLTAIGIGDGLAANIGASLMASREIVCGNQDQSGSIRMYMLAGERSASCRAAHVARGRFVHELAFALRKTPPDPVNLTGLEGV